MTVSATITAQKMKFSIKDFFSKYDQIRWKLRIWSHLLRNPSWKTSFFVQCIITRMSYKEPGATKKNKGNLK